MLLIAQIVGASVLISLGSAVVLLWLLLLAMSYGASGLMPWVAAGVVLYGVAFIAMAAVVGVPGILWAKYLSDHVQPPWRGVTKFAERTGTCVLLCGLGVALVVLVGEQFRPKNPTNGCVSWRSAAASAELAAGQQSGVDCPVRE
jgi:hypothetical protein